MNEEERKRKRAEYQRARRARPEIKEAHRKERKEYYHKNKDKVLERQRKNQHTPMKKLRIFKDQAKRRNFEIGISDEEICNYWRQECHYCGAIEPDKLNSIDRIDNSLGYITGNCITACIKCNRLKWTLSYDDFIATCKKIANKHNLQYFS